MIPSPEISMTGLGLVRHPYWTAKIAEWNKWRLVMEGGNEFINAYLKPYSFREDARDFANRKEHAPTPSFAKSALLEIRNSIFQRLADVARRGGTPSIREAYEGKDFGVDLHGSSMNQFIGMQMLPELLAMARVGIFVDMPVIEGNTLADEVGKRPYYYMYQAEDILSWNYRRDKPDEFDNLLVRDYTTVMHDLTGLPNGTIERVRHVWLEAGTVYMEWWYCDPTHKSEKNPDGTWVRQDYEGNPLAEPINVRIPVIPFVLSELSDSLLADVSNHQIALMNMESSDINYLLKSGFPFYVEEQDDRAGSGHLQGASLPGDDGTAAQANAGNRDREVKFGAQQGRAYGKGLRAPEFIHPSSEPIVASMAKQKQLKEDVRALMHLSLSIITSKMASKGSKQMDEHGLEAGMAAVGLVLEYTERKLSYYWSLYEAKQDVLNINYPQKYTLRSEEEIRDNALAWLKLREAIPSQLYQRNVSVEVARTLLTGRISQDDLDKVISEIISAPTVTADPAVLMQLVENGILDLELCAKIFGMPPETVAKAAQQHADRLARIAAAQTPKNVTLVKDGQEQIGLAPQAAGARGVPDMAASAGQGAAEKAQSRDQTQQDQPTDATRGEGK